MPVFHYWFWLPVGGGSWMIRKRGGGKEGELREDRRKTIRTSFPPCPPALPPSDHLFSSSYCSLSPPSPSLTASHNNWTLTLHATYLNGSRGPRSETLATPFWNLHLILSFYQVSPTNFSLMLLQALYSSHCSWAGVVKSAVWSAACLSRKNMIALCLYKAASALVSTWWQPCGYLVIRARIFRLLKRLLYFYMHA